MREGVYMDKEGDQRNVLKFVLSSLVGIILFFVPVVKSQVPIVAIVNYLQELLGTNINYIVLASCILLVVTYILGKFMNIEPFKKYHEADGYLKGTVYVLAVIFAVMNITQRGPEFIIKESIGGLAMSLAGSVLLTVTIAGWLVVFILKSGIVEMIGTIVEPVMRPIFKLPGEAAVNGIASFVSAPAVGVYITEQLYRKQIYTKRESAAVLTSFSVCSLGFFGVLVSIGNVVDLYPQIVLTSFLLTFVVAAIVVRIPPLSTKPNIYIDGHEQSAEDIEALKKGNIISRAISSALSTTKELTGKAVLDSLWDALKFAQNIVSYVISIAVIVLILTEYTPIFTWLGKPMIPILKLFGIPNALEIAPSTLIGIADVALPVMLLAGKDIAIESVFFIIVLSTLQIIFFTESANAMLESIIPVSALDLIIIFILRTLISIPLVAIATHILF